MAQFQKGFEGHGGRGGGGVGSSRMVWVGWGRVGRYHFGTPYAVVHVQCHEMVERFNGMEYRIYGCG